MLTEVRNNLRFVLQSIKCNMKSVFEYKKSFIIQVLFMIMNNGFFLIYWYTVFAINGGNVNGLVMKDILFLWTLPTAAWGLSNFVFGGLRTIDQLIAYGNMDSYLIQPKNLLLSIAVSKSDFGACGDLLYGLGIGVLACDSVFEYLQCLAFIIIGALFFMASFIIIRSFSIWVGDMSNIARTYDVSLLVNLSTYPFDIFGKVVKALMYTIIPAAYIAHLPIKILNNFNMNYLILILVMLIGYWLIALKLFYNAVDKYESGNNIAMKD